jgi:hypothetical protein
MVGRQSRLQQDVSNQARQRGIVELARRQVHSDAQRN